MDHQDEHKNVIPICPVYIAKDSFGLIQKENIYIFNIDDIVKKTEA